MSDTEDSGFDKEAERERLREKYDSEEADRAQTQQMSELLLQGATMTNRHCGECGNPIFRYEGQSFCSVCEEERPADTDSRPSAESTDASDASTQPESATESPQPESESIETRSGPEQPSEESGQPTPERRQDARLGRPTPEKASPDAVPEPERSTQPRAEGNIEAARASLVRTLSRMADEAEATEEVGRARDYLGAAREAAEALEAVERVRKR